MMTSYQCVGFLNQTRYGPHMGSSPWPEPATVESVPRYSTQGYTFQIHWHRSTLGPTFKLALHNCAFAIAILASEATGWGIFFLASSSMKVDFVPSLPSSLMEVDFVPSKIGMGGAIPTVFWSQMFVSRPRCSSLRLEMESCVTCRRS